jgi:hypothetical protein
MIFEGRHSMTVRELLDELNLLPSDAIIITAGCDCVGDVGEVSYDSSNNTVYLDRTDSHFGHSYSLSEILE